MLDEKARSLALDSLNNVYITGVTDSFGAGSSDIFLLKYDSQGNLLWMRFWGGILQDESSDILIELKLNVKIPETPILKATGEIELSEAKATEMIISQIE